MLSSNYTHALQTTGVCPNLSILYIHFVSHSNLYADDVVFLFWLLQPSKFQLPNLEDYQPRLPFITTPPTMLIDIAIPLLLVR